MTVFERIDRRVSLSPEENLLVGTVGRLADGKLEERAAGPRRRRHVSLGQRPRHSTSLASTPCSSPRPSAARRSRTRRTCTACGRWPRPAPRPPSSGRPNFHAVRPIITFGTDEQRSRLLPRIAKGGLAALCITEPGAGSDAAGMTTRLAPDGDAIVIDGGKELHHQRRRRRALSCLRKVVRDRRPQERDLGPGRRKGDARADGVWPTSTRWASGPRARPGWPSTAAACRARTSWASPATGCGFCSPRSTRRGRASAAPRPRHRPRRLRGRARLRQHAPPVGAPHRRVPGHPVPAGRSGGRAGAHRNRGCGTSAPWSTAAAEDFRRRGLDPQDARLGPGHAHGHRGRPATRRLRLLQGLPGGTPHAGTPRSPRSGRAPTRSIASSSAAASSRDRAGENHDHRPSGAGRQRRLPALLGGGAARQAADPALHRLRGLSDSTRGTSVPAARALRKHLVVPRQTFLYVPGICTEPRAQRSNPSVPNSNLMPSPRPRGPLRRVPRNP